tara:strand:- start:956 stop:1372 length:417 start_codon:yes stop_codon:yes gene_type:complete
MNNPIKHCYSNAMHTRAWSEMRNRQAKLNGRGTGNDKAYADAEKKRTAPLDIKEEAYEKQNRKMRKDHKKDTGKTLGKRQTGGTGKRRVSFACRFAGMKGSMKDAKGEPTRYAMALKKWGFGSREAARNFCNKNKEKK